VAPAGAKASGQWDYLLAPESICPGQNNPAAPPAAQAQTMVCMHNWARAQQGIGPLGVVRELRATSSRKARDIRRCQQFVHQACGRDTFYWFRKLGFMQGSYIAAENLAFGSSADWTVRVTMSHWLNSDPHRAVLLDPRFDQVGMTLLDGSFHGRPGMEIWVAHFGHQQATSTATSGGLTGSVYSKLVELTRSSY
jgi:uncharacterized protein YkwD